MATKTNGAEFKAFLKDEDCWAGDAYFEDEILVINGVSHMDDCELEHEKIEDTASVTIHGGAVIDSLYWVGKDSPSLETFFKQWKKKQSKQTLVIEFDKTRVAEVEKALRELKIKIIK